MSGGIEECGSKVPLIFNVMWVNTRDVYLPLRRGGSPSLLLVDSAGGVKPRSMQSGLALVVPVPVPVPVPIPSCTTSLVYFISYLPNLLPTYLGIPDPVEYCEMYCPFSVVHHSHPVPYVWGIVNGTISYRLFWNRYHHHVRPRSWIFMSFFFYFLFFICYDYRPREL